MDKNPVYKERSALTGMQVKEAMHKLVYRMPESTPIANCIRTIIKMKSNIILVDDISGVPSGVITKSDIMNAYYTGIHVETPEVVVESQSLLNHLFELSHLFR